MITFTQVIATSLIIIIVCFSDLEGVSECLLEQIRIYRNKQEIDEDELKTPGGIDLTNHEDVFRVVFEKVSESVYCIV